MRPIPIAGLIPLLALLSSCQKSDPGGDGPSLTERLAKFEPVSITADAAHLPESEQDALRHLVEAARLMHPVFLRQAWVENPELERTLTGDARALFDVHRGAWDRLDEEPFLPGDQHSRPDTAGYYPPDLTKAEFEAWLAAHPDDKEAFEGLFTMIVRDGEGLRAVPYSEFFREHLEPAAEHLRAAADATTNESLARFCRSRADAFLSDDYYQSDMDWMDLDSAVEITIGPYETYEDRLFGYKAAFEAFVTIADPDASEALALYKAELPAMERALPIPDEMKNPNRGTASPIRVVDVVYTAGDTRSGVQTIAFNLPNDERVRESKGSKKVLLRNVIQAKYDGILAPIARELVVAEQLPFIDAVAFSNQTLFHELSHGLGPGKIVKDGRDTEVRLELKELYSPIEEAKADIMGVWTQLFVMEKGLLDEARRPFLAPTWLAGLFRSIRFGVEEAHGKANMIQFNYMLDRGAVVRDVTGKYRVDLDVFEQETSNLVHDICVLQAHGDYEGTAEFFERYAEMKPELAADLERLEGIPVDIRPIYAADEER